MTASGLTFCSPVRVDWEEEDDSSDFTSEEIDEYYDVIRTFLNENEKLTSSMNQEIIDTEYHKTDYFVNLQSSEQKVKDANQRAAVLLFSMLNENLKMQSKLFGK